MRIEGTYLFDAPIEPVFAALGDPDVLGSVLPGFQRVIQFGPPDDAGQMHGEARVAIGAAAAPREFDWLIDPARIPRHLKYEARARDPMSAIVVQGFVDLVAREGQTVAAFVWDVRGIPGAHADESLASPAAGAAYLRRIGDALAARLAAQPRATVADALPVLRADSARGRITLLPADPVAEPVATRLRPMLNRGIWTLAGVVAAATLLAGVAAAVSWLRRRDGL
jgi:hypothetical protein